MNEIKLLKKARNLIDKNGWIRNDYGTRHGPCCVTGALVYSARYLYDTEAFRNSVMLISSILGTNNIPLWNDDDCRSKREAIKLFDTAIEILEGQ